MYQGPLVGRGIKKIHKVREHHQLVQNVNMLKAQAKEVGFIGHLIKTVEETLVNQKMAPPRPKDCKI